MSDIETFLNENSAPAARSSLSARILAAAEAAMPANDPANDIGSSRPWWSIVGVAAMALMAAFFVIQPLSTDPEEVEWDQIAEVSGFTDLYNWVEGDDS